MARRAGGMALVACLGWFVVLAAGCTSGKGKAQISTPPVRSNISVPSSFSAVLPTSPAPVTPTTAAGSNVSGSWSGRYSGAFTGTFQLSWQQAGIDLSGTITLSTQSGPVTLTGTISGDTIFFGTVGSSQAITYSGKVSGNSMSGTYQIGGAPGGPWSATKS
jgi:hypothetical protein